MYGAARKDVYLMCAVGFGIVANAYGSFTALVLLGKENQTATQHTMEYILIGGIAMWVFIGYFVGAIADAISADGAALSADLLGSLCSLLAIAYYVSPLSKVLTIIRTKDVSSLYMPMLVMNLFASFLWASYGLFGANDIFLFMCNAFAFVVTVLMVLLKLRFMNSTPMIKLTDEECGDEVELKEFSTTTVQYSYVQNPLFTNSNGAQQNPKETVLSKIPSSEEISGLRRRGSSVGEYASKLVGLDTTPAGFIAVPDDDDQKDSDENSYDSQQGRARRSSSIAEIASTVLLTTLDAFALAPPDNRSSIGSMGGKINEQNAPQRMKGKEQPTLITGTELDSSIRPLPPSTGVSLGSLPETDLFKEKEN